MPIRRSVDFLALCPFSSPPKATRSCYTFLQPGTPRSCCITCVVALMPPLPRRRRLDGWILPNASSHSALGPTTLLLHPVVLGGRDQKHSLEQFKSILCLCIFHFICGISSMCLHYSTHNTLHKIRLSLVPLCLNTYR